MDYSENSGGLVVSQNPTASLEDLKEILYRADPYECCQLAQNPDIDLELMENLFPRYPQEMLDNPAFAEAVASNPEFVTGLIAAYSEIVQSLFINEPWAKYLLSHPHEQVRQATSSNPNLPDSLWNFCITHHDKSVRAGIAGNQKLPYQKLAQIASEDAIPAIRAIAEEQINNRFPLSTQATSAFRPSTTIFKLQFPEPEPTKSGVLESKETRVHPFVFIIGLLSLACVAMLSMLFGQQNPPVNSMNGRGVSTGSVSSAKPLDEAMLIANEATSLAKESNLSTKQKKEIIVLWKKAIGLLEQVAEGSADYSIAQAKLPNYRNILKVAQSEVD
jgi:hypothetical protein